MFCDGLMLTVAGEYDEALERFHRTGPEFEGWLSNHGPMVVEALARWGCDNVVHRWTDGYLQRLDELPAERAPLAGRDWKVALGDASRIGDWVAFFHRELEQAGWQQVLGVWWPRLLPGIAAGATHGVIRVGHATHSLRQLESTPRRAELAHALGYWAARWQVIPVITPVGNHPAAELVGAVPRVARQESGARERLAQLGETPAWATLAASLMRPRDVVDVPAQLDALVDAVVGVYPRLAHGNATMLVHAATAPGAVAMALPSLSTELWLASFDAAWSASVAILAAYSPAAARPGPLKSLGADDALVRAVQHGSEHVIKFADTAMRSYQRSRDRMALAAIETAIVLDA